MAALAIPARPSRASSLLIITPLVSRAEDAKLAIELADDLVDALRATPGNQAGLFDSASATAKLAVHQGRLLPEEVHSPNEFGAPIRIARAFGADFAIFGALVPREDSRGRTLPTPQIQLHLGRVFTSSSSLIVTPPRISLVVSSEQALRDYAHAVAGVVQELIVPAATTAAGTTDSSGHWSEAQKALQSGDPAGAAGEMASSIQLSPENGQYKAGLAAVLLQHGDVARAVHLYQDAATQSPFDPDIRLGLGRSLYASGDYQAAARTLREAVRMAPHDQAAHLSLGRALASAGDLGGAVSELQQAGDDPDAEADLATLFTHAGHPEGAVTLLERAVKARPASGSLREQLATAQFAAGSPESAVRTLADMQAAHLTLTPPGRTTALSAARVELGALARAIETPGGDIASLQQRVGQVQKLMQSLPMSGKSMEPSRLGVAADDLQQALSTRTHSDLPGADRGDISVLLAQARRLLDTGR